MDYYLPIKLAKQSSKRVFDMLMIELNNTIYPCERKNIIADQLHLYLQDPFDIEMGVRWLEKGYIHSGGVACGTPEVRLYNSTKDLEN